MKLSSLILIIFALFSVNTAKAQNDSISKDTNVYRILLTDGTQFFGQIITQDPRELLIITTDNRQMYIPQYVIKR